MCSYGIYCISTCVSHPSINFFSLGLALLNLFPVAGYNTLSLLALLVEQFLLLL